ncbi:TPA: TIGR03905 family TSCPD domain-containing protein [Clostridium botulinum]|uniref:TIGR03905 family TSCPD domain-containing protein n=1 Tax=Clostridium botulinum TaxID=1491 RepID=UPI0029A03E72|nr:TIGR03905 family TSCPD domain-containing protein [Clostridium botulinum]HDK7180459.1 TIGR03905 family TSCPD domain-containing protein [Clostridium botulinum]HDK7189823.1 TIGR03905 family TSCPD domain-containing protein [Clostridium botulinum]HDK7217897.1 TIGR03905 family TSCPD domain-containing protein [Clostridium botulinum]HDK7226005.1 TIGR03905 family TSCPD domain-containing protein [Clostridium botulinum]
MYTYLPIGVCSKKITFDILNNKVVKVNFLGGCDGNLKGLSSLIEGMDIDDAIKRLQGITCGSKNTSCPDQLSKALQEAKKQNKESI